MEKRQSGQLWRPPSAADHNAQAEATEFYLRRQRLSTAGNSSRADAATAVISTKNTTGADRRKGEVLEVFDLLPDALDEDGLWFEGDTPLAAGNVFGILKEASPENEIQRLQLAGVVIALVNVTDEDHERATVKAGEVVLQSSAGGSVQILYKPAGTGELECAVLLGGTSTSCDEVRFNVESADPETRTVIASVTGVPEGCSLADVPGRDTLDLITVCDPLGCYFNEPSGELLGRDGWAKRMLPLVPNTCQPVYLSPQWEVFALCCPTPECDE